MKRWFFQAPVMLACIASFACGACGAEDRPLEAPPPAPPLGPAPSSSASQAIVSVPGTTTAPTATNATPLLAPEKCVAGAFDPALGCVAPAKAADAKMDPALLALIADVQKNFPDASKKKCPAKTREDLFGDHSLWNQLSLRANDFDRKFTAISTKLNTPRATAIADAESGLVFARLAMALRACNEDNIELFDAKQRQLIATMNASGRDDLKETSNELVTKAKEAFRARKDSESEAIDELALRRVATSVAIANAYGFGDDAIRDAWSAWSDLATMIGPGRAAYFERTRDPIDPDGSRAIARFSESFAPKWTSSARGAP